jgi:hypothetical protein
MSDRTDDSITERAKIACSVCGAPWTDHDPTCSRHEFRPRTEPVKAGRKRKAKGG